MSNETQRQGAEQAGEGKFCGNCGFLLGLAKCAHCGAQNQQGVNFCGECGAKL